MDLQALIARMMGKTSEPDSYWSPWRQSENVEVRPPAQLGALLDAPGPTQTPKVPYPEKRDMRPRSPLILGFPNAEGVSLAANTPKGPGSPSTLQNDPAVLALKRLLGEGLPEPFNNPLDVDTANLQRYAASLRTPEFTKEQIADAYRRWPKE